MLLPSVVEVAVLLQGRKSLLELLERIFDIPKSRRVILLELLVISLQEIYCRFLGILNKPKLPPHSSICYGYVSLSLISEGLDYRFGQVLADVLVLAGGLCLEFILWVLQKSLKGQGLM